MSSIRLTIIDDSETISFVAPGHALKMGVACCARNPVSAREFVSILGEYDPALASKVESSLSHDVAGEPAGADVVVVVPGEDRGRTLEESDSGLVMFNLPAKRIVQVSNRIGAIERSDRGRMRRNGRPVQVFYTYALPEAWSIVP